VFGVQTMGITQAFEWFSKFKRYVMSIQDAECMRSPSVRSNDENVDQVKELVLQYK
jgi:hypothetical protein